jgi:hypothetical protein
MRRAGVKASIAAVLLIAATGTCLAEDGGPKICAVQTDFAKGASFPVEALKTRLSDLGTPSDKKTWEDVDTSCSLMTMMGGFAALPTVHLGSSNGKAVVMTLQVAGRNGQCMATVVSLDGC